MRFVFGDYTVEVDVEKTREYYRREMPENDCECSGCRNFRKYAEVCPEEIKRAFAELGIDDINYILEIIPFDCAKEDYDRNGGNFYGGFYAVVGELIGGEPIDSQKSTRRITSGFGLFLHDSMYKPDNFPDPAFNINIEAWIPWLIDAENEYVY